MWHHHKFSKILIFVIATFVFASHGSMSIADSSLDIAVKMVEKFGFGLNLKTLGVRTASRTLTYAIMIRDVGPYKAKTLINEELDRALPDFQDEWNRNLAESYLEHLPTEELRSIYELGPKSPYKHKIKAVQDVGRRNNAEKSKRRTR